MSGISRTLVPYPSKYGPMPLEKRRAILSERNVCSLAPSLDYADAISTGNGYQRVDILGDPYRDELAFSHEALYTPRWAKTPEPPDLTAVMPTVRKLLREGKFDEAAELVEKAQIEAGFGPHLTQRNAAIMPPTSLRQNRAFWLQVRQPEAGETRNYLRWLDMLTGKVTVQWENAQGAFARELFAAYKGDVVLQRLTAPSRGALDVEIAIRLPGSEKPGTYRSMFRPELCSHELELTEDLFTLKWAYYPEYGQKGYVSVIRFVRQGGRAERIENGIRVSGADSMLVLSKTVKFEGGFTYACAEPVVAKVLAIDPDWNALLAYNREYLGSRM